jgi:glucose/arabinose dehydrogenase
MTTTATITSTAPPVSGVEQPPYAPSACSDKYPCNDDKAGWEARIRVPAGFQVTYYGRVEASPTSITFGPDDLLYIATMQGTIYRLDNSGNVSAYVSGFIVPTGLAFQPGTSKLYVSSRAINQDIGGEAKVSIVQGGAVSTIISGLPCCYTSYHSANGIAFGPDGFGYVGVGGRADHGEVLVGPTAGQQDELHPLEASILRFSPDGTVIENYARGFRNPYDVAWDGNGQLWATDNTPDFDPPERLHRVAPGGQHGYPYYDCAVCFTPPPGVQVIPPAATFIPSSSPTGIAAYLSNQFPGYYNSLFLTLWSSFPGAQKVVRLGPGGSSPSNFATGFAAPIDVTIGPDGSLYVADWATGIIFKISYTG